MAIKSLFFILATALLFSNAACQKSSGAGGNGDTVQPLYVGDLDKKMNEIYGKSNEPRMDNCDLQLRMRILEVSRALEQNRANIEKLAESTNSSGPFPMQNFGPFKFINDITQAPGEDKWVVITRSWYRIINQYDLIKNNPTDSHWVSLNRSARGMVLDDDSRITYGTFYGLSKDAGPLILQIAKKADTCVQNNQCTDPGLDDQESVFLSTNIYYRFYMAVFKSSKYTFDKKREVVQRFAKATASNTLKYGFFNNTLLRMDGNTLVVPLDLTVFGDEGAQKFIDLTEKAWNIDPKYSVRIQSVKDGSPAYKILVDTAPGGRASVNHQQRVMNLFDEGRVKTFTHEFGHILGFKDRYFTTWDARTCQYSQESNYGDLMSDSTSGSVLPSHWLKLQQVFWPTPALQSQ